MAESLQQFHSHPRRYEQNKFVYPVVSRRSRGISIGVNLNPDKICNFDCIYCQVDRRSESETRFVELDRLLEEIDHMLTFVTSGEIYHDPRFAAVPDHFRRLNDIAFSGDGEPTTFKNFDEIMGRVADLKQKHHLPDVKLVLITNASMFHREKVQQGLAILDKNNGEIWAKLDAGTENYYHLVDRTKIPFQRILDNLLAASRVRPLVIQSLFMRVAGEPPSGTEIDAYVKQLNAIRDGGGELKLVQIYTVARPPAESFVTPLTDDEVDALAKRVITETGIPAEAYYS